jgi:hypothetical protein
VVLLELLIREKRELALRSLGVTTKSKPVGATPAPQTPPTLAAHLTRRIAAEIKTAAAPIMIQKTVWNICWSDGAV